MSDTPETCPDVFTGGRHKPRSAVPPHTVYVVLDASGVPVGIHLASGPACNQADHQTIATGARFTVEEWFAHRQVCEVLPISARDALAQVRAAGGYAWDDIADPHEFVRWMRGDDVGAEYEYLEGKWVRVPLAGGPRQGGAEGEQK